MRDWGALVGNQTLSEGLPDLIQTYLPAAGGFVAAELTAMADFDLVAPRPGIQDELFDKLRAFIGRSDITGCAVSRNIHRSKTWLVPLAPGWRHRDGSERANADRRSARRRRRSRGR